MSDLCMGCMTENNGEDVCPKCGFSKDYDQQPPYLQLKTLLRERYITGKAIKDNAESIIYIGYDKYTSTPVTIREFFPRELCTRINGVNVEIPSDKQESYGILREEFLNIYRNVSRFKELSAIVNVLDIFSENNTSYVIEEKEDNIPFREYIERSGGSLEWDAARPLFMPVLSALSKLNQSGQSHFGISPDNLAVSVSGKMKLLNFSVKELHKANDIITPEFYSGCSAPEQYSANAEMSEYTDIYSFTAILFYALTGKCPADAQKRMEDGRLLISTNVVKRLPPHVISALANGLQVDVKSRIKDFETLRAQLSAAPTVKAIQEEIARPAALPPVEDEEEDKKRISNFACGVIALVLGLIIFSVAGYFWVQTNPFAGTFKPSSSSAATDPSSSTEPNLSPEETYPPDSKFFRVPNLIGMEFEKAKEIADNDASYNIYKALDEAFSDTVPEGYICEQSPEALSTVNKGIDGVTISATISKGPKTRELPKVEGVSLDKAASLLAKDHFVTNTVVEFSDTVEKDTVIGYSDEFKEGQKLDYGSEVTIIVSMGKKPEVSSAQSFDASLISSE